MKIITEALLREELKDTNADVYYLQEDTKLSPAAKEYLSQKKIRVQSISDKSVMSQDAYKYVDYFTGAFYKEKPENMTQLKDNFLIPKNHVRIVFRGKLDKLSSSIVLFQSIISNSKGSSKLIEDLDGILKLLYEMMRCDALGEEYKNDRILGFNHQELRERSHNPKKYYNIEQMKLPDYALGIEYTLLNYLRTIVRETEIAALDAGKEDLIKEFNRLSSAIHIMMCMYLAGYYK